MDVIIIRKDMQNIINEPYRYAIIKIIGDVRVGHHKYLHVLQENYNQEEHVLIPYTGGTWATAIPYDSYEYTHGGKIYRAAVERVHKLSKI